MKLPDRTPPTPGEHLEEPSPDSAPSAADQTPAELLVGLLLATHLHDRAGRKRFCDALDATGWEGASVLLAAAKIVALDRRKSVMERDGVAQWVQETAKDTVARHAAWMRLQVGQIAAMLRAGLGNHDLGTTVGRPTRGRLDATVLEHLIAESLDYGDDFAEEAIQVLEEAAHLLRRPIVAEELSGY